MEPTIAPLSEWSKGRDETVENLLQIAKDVSIYAKRCEKVDVAGKAIGLTGTAAGGLAVLAGSAAAAPLAGVGFGVAAGMKIGTQFFHKYISNTALKKTQDLLDKDSSNSKAVQDAMAQLCEVEVGIYQQLSHHIETSVECSGTKAPAMRSNRLRRTTVKGNYGIQDLLKGDGVPLAILQVPVVQQGLEVIRQQNLESVQKLMGMCMDGFRQVGPAQNRAVDIVQEIAKIAKQFKFTGLLTSQSVMSLARYAKSWGIVSSATIPIQIIDLLTKANALYKGDENKLAIAIKKKAEQMREEAKEIDKHIRTIVTDLSNLVLLINFIKKRRM